MKNAKITASLLSALMVLTPVVGAVPVFAQGSQEDIVEIQQEINSLPSLEQLINASSAQQLEIYEDLQDLYDDYQELSAAQQQQLTGTEKFEELFEWYNAQIMPIDSSAEITLIQAGIDALPTVDELSSANSYAQLQVYMNLQELYDEYQELSAAQKEQLTGTEKFEELFGWYNSQIMPIDSSTEIALIQNGIDALPSLDELKEMSAAQINEIYFNLQDLYDDYKDLSADQQAMLSDTQKMEELLAWYADQTMPYEEEEDTIIVAPGPELSGAGITEEGSQTVETEEGSTTYIMDEKGVQSITVRNAEGTITEITINVPETISGQQVAVDMAAYPAGYTDANEAPVIYLNVPSKNTLLIPVEETGPSTVLGVWKSEDSYWIDAEPVVENGFMYVPVQGEYETFIFNNAKEFEDVAPTNEYYDAIEFVASRDLMNGTKPGTFDPDGNITRGMLARVIWNMYHDPEVKVDNTFNVPEAAYYYEAVQFVYQEGFMTGYSDTDFGGEMDLSKEQLITVLWRMMGSPIVETEIDAADADQIAPAALDAMKWAVAEGIIEPEDNMLNPAALVNRAQLADILESFIETGTTRS